LQIISANLFIPEVHNLVTLPLLETWLDYDFYLGKARNRHFIPHDDAGFLARGSALLTTFAHREDVALVTLVSVVPLNRHNPAAAPGLIAGDARKTTCL